MNFDEQAAEKCLALAFIAFPNTPASKFSAQGWVKVLGDLYVDEVEQGLLEVLRKSEYWPTFAAIREEAEPYRRVRVREERMAQEAIDREIEYQYYLQKKQEKKEEETE